MLAVPICRHAMWPSVVKAETYINEDITADTTVDIVKSVCLGLDFAHAKGIIHRDLKPGNVYLTEEGMAKISDFSIPSIGIGLLTRELIPSSSGK